MKAIATLTFGIASSVGACIAAASFASFVMADPQPQKVASLHAPDLWTTSPVRVDPSRQHYQRLPAAYSSYVTEAPKVAVENRRPDPMHAKPEPSRPVLSTAHLQWCSQRYRSFDPATNSYRSYSGETRSCKSPYGASQLGEDSLVANANDRDHGASTLDHAYAAWCAARYASYREEDNSYQPYDGPRRKCVPPSHAVIASAQNEIRRY
ncbi:BA14K family protein [Rhizobium sp. WYCCWR 11279]|uniref:BA14K family protein n=1 Tax=Rhizobium changzhiense TaxID=2692317 RepID=UPI001492CDE7|nr:BA14K family protein [Rhizobium changzhiense]NNU48849.1 BA14K family protein [Rhizobium changzhiense]